MLRDTTPTEVQLNGQSADDKGIAAVYRCKLTLEQLKDTDHPDVKYCDQCRQNVFKGVDFDSFEKAAASRGCVGGHQLSRRVPFLGLHSAHVGTQ
jgi:hypothetical protein